MTSTLLDSPPPCYFQMHSCGDGDGTAPPLQLPATRQQEPPLPLGGSLRSGANVSGMTSLPGMVAL